MKNTWIPLAVLGVLAAGAALYFASSRPGSSTEMTPGQPGTAVSSAPGGAPMAPVPRAEEHPLPPTDLPLNAVIGDLKRRADRGEANAACRLAAEWTHCLGLQRQLQRNEAALRSRERIALRLLPEETGGSTPPTRVSIDAIERGVNRALAEVERSKSQLVHCEGVAMPPPEEVTRYWRQAALAGHLPSMRNYAVGNAFRRDDLLNNLPALAIYRQEAEGIARQAADRGDLRAAIALASAYSPLPPRRGSFLSQIVTPNATESLALSYRINDAIQNNPAPALRSVRSELAGRIEGLEAMLSPQDIQQARGRAGTARPLSAEAQDLQGSRMLAGGFVADASREECDATPWSKAP